MIGRRPWLAVVLALFCLPLFVNLGREDLGNDEAIYSFAVDRIVASGDWLVPKALPHDDLAFFEKPPLKFWIVAAPIAAGLVAGDEFGLRVWDAIFGAAAFVYVFLIGCRLLNPFCGAVAVLLLFAHPPILFSHGLRSNNMEAPLVLAYCGGVYHYLAWTAKAREARLKGDSAFPGTTGHVPTGHVLAIALYFVLAFMTKFVAALFLPAILGAAALLVRDHRRLLAREWRAWGLAAIVVLALIAPWFVFASARFGAAFWRGIFGVHVLQRFTSYLDPGHLRPWHYYLTEMAAFWETAALALMFSGLGILGAWTARRRSPEAAVIVLWFVLPMAAISAGTSKLYHYAYPFLPALALGGGYLVALAAALGPAPFSRMLDGCYAVARARMPRASRLLQTPAAKALLIAGIAFAAVLAIGSLLFGQVRVAIGGAELKSAGVLRPGLAALVCAVLVGIPPAARRTAFMLLIVSVLPLQGYRDSLALLGVGRHPKRSASDCVRGVQARAPALDRGVLVDLPDGALSQSLFYYFDRVGPIAPSAAGGDGRPVLVPQPVGASGHAAAAAVAVDDNVMLLLPAPYAACADTAAPRG